jgi:general secretion pathway protein G
MRENANTIIKRILPSLLIVIFAFALLPNHCESSSTKVGSAEAEIWLLEFALYRLGTDVCRLPTTDEGLKPLVEPGTPMLGWQGPYLPKALSPDPWGNDYRYYYPPRYGNKKFDLYSLGADKKDDHGEGDDISNWKGYDRKYYKQSHWGYQEITMLLIMFDFPAAVLIYLSIVLYKRYERIRRLKTSS